MRLWIERTTGHFARKTSIATCLSAWIRIPFLIGALAQTLIFKPGLKPNVIDLGNFALNLVVCIRLRTPDP